MCLSWLLSIGFETNHRGILCDEFTEKLRFSVHLPTAHNWLWSKPGLKSALAATRAQAIKTHAMYMPRSWHDTMALYALAVHLPDDWYPTTVTEIGDGLFSVCLNDGVDRLVVVHAQKLPVVARPKESVAFVEAWVGAGRDLACMLDEEDLLGLHESARE